MSFTPGSLLLLLLVCSFSPVHGVLEAYNTNLKCKCVKRTLDTFSFRHIDRIRILPPGNGCPNKEIIIWTKNKSIICLNPQSTWTQRFMKALQKRKLPTPPATVFKEKIA
ncbi:C-X-C motif chemokine 13 [Manis pentadactyla]|uniref:C-X-C motif chemokine 13 n=1 Tax=Manis pentadactyla TaxID=143292 RepID=UPI001874B96E|nr:C-X-C motif chemokine 13 [Manis pentadactyla]KAI5278874.1 C-X-C Motif Chemokine 13 [Manis pentadactyla]